MVSIPSQPVYRALMWYPKCITTSHITIEYLSITTAKQGTITVAGLDYVSFKLNHLKRPTTIEDKRTPLLSVKPRFIFRTGHHPIRCQDDSTGKPQSDNRGKEQHITKRSLCGPPSDSCYNPQHDAGSKGDLKSPSN